MLEAKIPSSVLAEHEQLHAELARLTNETNQIGAVAREVAALMGPHFAREEQFALPPLGVLPALAEGRITTDMRAAAGIARKLKSLMPQMLSEHIALVGALQTLMNIANEVDRPDVVAFARTLIAHAQMEEEVLYPAAIVVGDYLVTRLDT